MATPTCGASPAAGGAVEPVVGGDIWVNGFDAAGGVVVHAASTPTMPNEIFVGDRQLTEVSKAFTRAGALPAVRALRGHLARR